MPDVSSFPPYAIGAFIDLVPESVLQDLREAGYPDEKIERMSPREAFDAYCTWNGLINWGDTLWSVASAFKAIQARCAGESRLSRIEQLDDAGRG